MSALPRLIKVLNVAAKYNLLELYPEQVSLPARSLLRLYGLPWTGNRVRKLPRYQRLRLALEELGPIYIKFGQLLSTRRDFLDPALADELQNLQDNVPPFDKPAIETLVRQSLGAEPDTIFKELESTPFASASIAQVHKATLMSGEEVVIKVIRPGIEQTIRSDLKLMKFIAALVEDYSPIGRRLHPAEVVRDYELVILDELNLQMEAANTAQLRRNFEHSDELYVPKVYWDYTRRNILVMERIHGIPVADVESLNAHHVDLKKLAETGVNIFFTQVFEHNFFHADMHPGNIFVARDTPDNPRYIAIDCAIIGTLSDSDQEYLARNLLAIFKRDYRKVAELHVACGWVPPDTPVGQFESAMRSVCEPIFEKPLAEISFGQLLVQLFSTAGRFNMEVQPSLVLLQKTLLNIEGLGRQLYPELDLWATAMPYLENWRAKRLNPFTLLGKLKDSVPEWVEQMPQLPEMIIDAIAQGGQVNRINESLQAQLKQQEQLARQRRKRRQLGAAIALVLAGLGLVPVVTELVSGLPLFSAAMALLGVYLLYSRD